MTIAVTSLGTASNTSGATLTLSITVPAGAAIIVGVCEFNTQTAGTLSDATNGAYTAVKTQSNAGGPSQVTAFVFLNSASLTTITLTYTKGLSGSRCVMSAVYATGILTSGAVDSAVTVGASSAAANPPVLNLTSGTPGISGELFIGFSGGEANSVTPTWNADTGNGWNTPPPFSVVQSGTTNSDAWLSGGYVVNSGSGTKVFNPSVNAGNGARTADTVIIGLKPGGSSYSVSITESGSAADTPSGAALFPVTNSESGSASDTPSGSSLLPATNSESGTATDTTNGIVIWTVTENATAADTNSATQLTSASISETQNAADTVSASAADIAAIAESGTAAEATSSSKVSPGSIAETGSSADTPSAIKTIGGAVAEVGSAVDQPSAIATLNVSIIDHAYALDRFTRALPMGVPQYALAGTYSESFEDSRVTFQPEVGPPKVRRKTSKSSVTIGFQTFMSSAQYSAFMDFYRVDLKYGTAPFAMLHPRLSNTMADFNFLQIPSATYRSVDLYRVDIKVRPLN